MKVIVSKDARANIFHGVGGRWVDEENLAQENTVVNKSVNKKSATVKKQLYVAY